MKLLYNNSNVLTIFPLEWTAPTDEVDAIDVSKIILHASLENDLFS